MVVFDHCMMKRKPFTLLIHIALVIILMGAMCTHFFCIQGEMTIKDGEKVSTFTKSSGPGDGCFPFDVALINADVEFYPGTTTPMNFKSVIRVNGRSYDIAMNSPAVVAGWRFYQSGMNVESSTFAVSHDPWGIGITYLGYLILTIGLIGFFLQKKTAWRALLRRPAAVAVLMIVCVGAADASELPTMQRPLAADMGKVYVYWNDRISPMQTMARDVSRKLYGKDSYKGMTAEQVLAGWLFYFDEWLNDYIDCNPEISNLDIDRSQKLSKSQKKLLERKSLITIIGTGEAFKIYPYQREGGYTEWLSLTGRRPAEMSLEQWEFMQTTMPQIKRLLMQGKNIRADEEVKRLIVNQKKYAGEDNLPSDSKVEAEIIYNRMARPLVTGIFALLLSAFYLYVGVSARKPCRCVRIIGDLALWLNALAITGSVVLSWWLSGHVPLSNGTEMVLFMADISLMLALLMRSGILKGAFVMVASMSLMVAGMASRTPQIGSLMPVLASPLLSVHVMVIMCAYVLFLLMAVLSVIALVSKEEWREIELCRINRIILLPAVTLLALGIMIGAVWANQSWGRYWGWDPKETCALIMLLVYVVPLHWALPKFSCFRRPKILHIYLLVALGTVLFTYFGANFLIPGLHSYA